MTESVPEDLKMPYRIRFPDLAMLKIPIPGSIIGSEIKRQSRFQRLFYESLLELNRNPKSVPV
jgi:hypothetical protein